MKKKLLISAFVTTLSLLNSSLNASEKVFDEMEPWGVQVHNLKYPDGLPISTHDSIRAFQTTLGIPLIPTSLQQYWIRFGHISFPCRSMIRPYTHTEYYINIIHTAWDLGVSKEWLPFYSADGNYYCIHLETGVVRLWDFHTLDFSKDPDDQWNTFFEWIEKDWLPLIKS